jgi:hypothetical protein
MEDLVEKNLPEFHLTYESYKNDEQDEEITRLTRRKEVLDLVLGRLIETIKETTTETHGK